MKNPIKAIKSIQLKTSPGWKRNELNKRFRSYSGIPKFVRQRLNEKHRNSKDSTDDGKRRKFPENEESKLNYLADPTRDRKRTKTC